MTRETKIGLLVGLAFIIVIGILLSDHFRGTMEPAPATLDRAGANVREGVVSPGANQSPAPIAIIPDDVNPTSQVQTPRDLDPRPSPIVLNPTAQQQTSSTQGQIEPPSNGNSQTDALQQAARQQGQDIVPVNNGALAMQANPRGYQAVAGDSVSRMAAKLLGANTARNRRAIIAANPSLQDNPNMVVVGQTYVIPGQSTPSIPGTVAVPNEMSTGGYVYVVKGGDTLWGIATGQLNNAAAVEAIKELNRITLHGGSTIRAGMKLRLPSAPVATVAD